MTNLAWYVHPCLLGKGVDQQEKIVHPQSQGQERQNLGAKRIICINYTKTKKFIFSIFQTCFVVLKETWPLKKMYVSSTDPSCQNWFPDFLLVTQNSFTTAYPMNCQNNPVLAAWIRT